MKKTLILILGLLTFFSCTTKKQKTETKYAPITYKDLENAVIYEANIRQYSKEGTFNAFTKDILQLKN
jgi:hypothetical protein